MQKLNTINCEGIMTQPLKPIEFVVDNLRVTVVTVKISLADFADLPAPDSDKSFCNTLSAGDGNFRGDGKSLKRVPAVRAYFGRFERGSEQNRVSTRLTRLEGNLRHF